MPLPRLALLALVLLLPALAAAEPAFAPGESLVFDTKYLGVRVGRAMVMVGAETPVDGQKVWPIVGLAKTEPQASFWPVKDRFVTWWSPSTRTAIGHEYHVDHNHWRRRERVRYDRAAKTASFLCEKEYAPRFEERIKVEDDTRDLVAALFTLRERKLAVGDVETVSVYTGKKVFPMKATVLRSEKIEVAAGTFDSVVLELKVDFSGQAAAKTVNLWVSNDARHVPLRFDAEFLFGKVYAELSSYQKGVAP